MRCIRSESRVNLIEPVIPGKIHLYRESANTIYPAFQMTGSDTTCPGYIQYPAPAYEAGQKSSIEYVIGFTIMTRCIVMHTGM
jgi:hypothetical protein